MNVTLKSLLRSDPISTPENTSAVKMLKRENPQFNAMYQKEMWDMIKIVLDNCRHKQDFDFKMIDPPFNNIQMHPLMLLAKSGQEFLLKHPTVEKLLSMKWRFLPRFVFYANITLFLLFLILYSVYAVKLSNIDANFFEDSEPSPISDDDYSFGNSSNNILEDTYYKEVASGQLAKNATSFDTRLKYYIIVVLVISFVKKLFQFGLIDGLAFLTSFQNWFEIVTYLLALGSILMEDVEKKLTYSSIAILLAYIVFIFLIQKLRVFGLYVLAFKRTLGNSAKFFPIFLLIYTGFNLSFRLRTHFGVSYYNITSSASIIKTLTMVIGELDSNEMGLDNNSLANYLLYFLFISIMCVIVINLFVGIAVGEINTVLDEADIQQISMRIIFVLKVQETLNPFLKNRCMKKYFDLRFVEYNHANEYKLIRSMNKVFRYLEVKFTAKDNSSIKLDDPQKRLEDSITRLAFSTSQDLNVIKENLTNQINDSEIRLANSQKVLGFLVF